MVYRAGVVKLANTYALGAYGRVSLAGSSPVLSIFIKK